jgi:plastocyanin
MAQETNDDGGSERGRGRGRGGDDDQGNSGPGNVKEAALPLTGVVPEGAAEVRVVDDDAGGFVPSELTVDLGQTVAFVNAHHDEHTATGAGFDTGVIGPGQFATVVFDTPGSFPYACQIHPVMTGKISVRGEDGVVPEAQAAA